MTLIYGTKNKAKLESMGKWLESLGLTIIGLEEAGLGGLHEPAENGYSPAENARAKARFYFAASGRPTFSADSGLYFDGLPEKDQPGVHIRRVGGKRLDDNEMIGHYAGLARQFGGKITGRYRNALCLITEKGEYEHSGEDIASEPFAICATPHPRRVEGFPLDCLSIHIESGMYYYDYELVGISNSMIMEDGFREFFKSSLKMV